jgi:hypothetical protein
MKAIQHLPNYSSCEKEENHFLNLEQLLSIPFVKWYSDQSDFHKFSLSIDEDECSLMAEINGGEDWWVVCDIIGKKKDIKNLNLPKFEEE